MGYWAYYAIWIFATMALSQSMMRSERVSPRDSRLALYSR